MPRQSLIDYLREYPGRGRSTAFVQRSGYRTSRMSYQEVAGLAAQRQAAEASKAAYQKVLSANGYGPITTEIAEAPPFYYAEDYHQQYLAKNPWGYCGLGGTGVACPVGIAEAASR